MNTYFTKKFTDILSSNILFLTFFSLLRLSTEIKYCEKDGFDNFDWCLRFIMFCLFNFVPNNLLSERSAEYTGTFINKNESDDVNLKWEGDMS